MIAWWWLIIVFYAGVGFGAWLILWCRERAEDALSSPERAEDQAAARVLDEGQVRLTDYVRRPKG